MIEEILGKSRGRDVLIIFIASVAIIAIWRGLWNILDEYFIAGDFLISQIVSIVIGLWILILLSGYKKKTKSNLERVMRR